MLLEKMPCVLSVPAVAPVHNAMLSKIAKEKMINLLSISVAFLGLTTVTS
jgi:hypothetical protein